MEANPAVIFAGTLEDDQPKNSQDKNEDHKGSINGWLCVLFLIGHEAPQKSFIKCYMKNAENIHEGLYKNNDVL